MLQTLLALALTHAPMEECSAIILEARRADVGKHTAWNSVIDPVSAFGGGDRGSGRALLGIGGESGARHNPDHLDRYGPLLSIMFPELAPFFAGAQGYAHGGPGGGALAAGASFAGKELGPVINRALNTAVPAGTASGFGADVVASPSLDSAALNLPTTTGTSVVTPAAESVGGNLGSSQDINVIANRPSPSASGITPGATPVTPKGEQDNRGKLGADLISTGLNALAPNMGATPGGGGGGGSFVRPAAGGGGIGGVGAAGLANAGALKPKIYPWAQATSTT